MATIDLVPSNEIFFFSNKDSKEKVVKDSQWDNDYVLNYIFRVFFFLHFEFEPENLPCFF